MTDFDDLLLREAFADYSDQTALRIKPAGAQAADESVRHRRRVRGVTIAVVAVLAFVVPVAAYALAARPTGRPPVGTSETPHPTPVPTQSPSAEPKETPPPGGLTGDELKNATFTLPSWDDTSFTPDERCTSGARTFINSYSDPAVYIGDRSYVDIDHDGKYETIVRMKCDRGVSELSPQRLVVVGRGADGQIRTFGQVVTTKEGILQIGDFTGRADGSIRVDVRDRGLCCATPYTDTQHQWRTFAWNGGKFTQTAGATQFTTETADLAVTMTHVILSPPQNGVRQGILQITVHNKGTRTVPKLLLVAGVRNVDVPFNWKPGTLFEGTLEFEWSQPLPASGMQFVGLNFTTTATNLDMVGIDIMAIAVTSDGDFLRDTNPNDNQGVDIAGIPAVIRFQLAGGANPGKPYARRGNSFDVRIAVSQA